MEVEDIVLLQQGIDYLTKELLVLEWVAKTPDDLDILWNGIRNLEWSDEEMLRNKLAWLNSRLKFHPLLNGKKREGIRERWLLKNSTELYLRYFELLVRYNWGSFYGPVKEFKNFWNIYFPLSKEPVYIEEKLEPLVAELTDEEFYALRKRIAGCFDDYRLNISSSMLEKFQLLPLLDFSDTKQVRKLGGKRKTEIEAEERKNYNHYIKVLAIFLSNCVLDQNTLNETISDDNCIATNFREYVRESLSHSYFDAWNHFRTGAPDDESSGYYNWKISHQREYNLFKNEASEAILRAMYNYNHPDEPIIVKFEPNFIDLNDFSMSIEPIKG